ncbi:hypothetical protein ACFPJ4_00745 [Lysinimonas soli]|uniref:Condensation domain-containing protein n=1 Tax=Lysinimonas soli TaxID=1074233 RepID=A0ABW0NKE1_9MICO
MTLAPSYSPQLPNLSDRRIAESFAVEQAVPLPGVQLATVDVTALVELSERLDRHARRDGGRVSTRALVARAFLAAAVRHPRADALWDVPGLAGVSGAGLRVSELTAALDGATAARAVNAGRAGQASSLSVGELRRQPAEFEGRIELRWLLTLSLSFAPDAIDAVEVRMLLDELAAMLADPFELVARV